MGQLSSFQETQLANRDSLAKHSIGEDSVLPNKQYATTSDSHVIGDLMVHSKVADEMLDGNIVIEEEENEFLANVLLYLSCQRDPDKPRCKASQMLAPATKGEASEPSLVEVTVESKLDLANLNPEEQNRETELTMMVSWLSVLMPRLRQTKHCPAWPRTSPPQLTL